MNKILVNRTMILPVAIPCDKIRTDLANSDNFLCIFSKNTETKITFISILLVTLSKFNIFDNSMYITM